MKKLMIMLAMAVTTAVAVAETNTTEYPVLDYKTATEAQYREVFNQIISATPKEAYNISKVTKFSHILERNDLDTLISEIDVAYAERIKEDRTFAIHGMGWDRGRLPISGKQKLKGVGLEDDYASILVTVNRLKANGTYGPTLLKAGATLDDFITVLSEFCIFPSPIYYMTEHGLKKMKESIQKKAATAIKRKLREQGKTFVTKDGVNPCEEYLTRLNAALDAPRFAGLNAWLEELGFEARLNESKMLSEEYIHDLKEKIFYGERDNTPFTRVVLLTYLGVDGYNEFVKEYNSGK